MTMRQWDEDLWLFEGETVPFMGLPYATRMTVVRLPDGGLWVHSPIRLTPERQRQLDGLGPVHHLVAPNHLHHLFLDAWQRAYPGALTHGTPELIAKRRDLRFDGTLEAPHPDWQPVIDQRLFTGSPRMAECVFFHRPSATLIVADLVENFPPESLRPWQRWLARVTGILAPHGGMPLDWRLTFLGHRRTARAHLEALLDWAPERLILSHGRLIEHDAQTYLIRAFHWLR
ncbi:DUF4336 domain-containing protein [Halomonas organivorans]